MSDLRQRARRTLPVVILDATLALGAALTSGHLPWLKGKIPRTRRSAVIWVTVAAVVAAAGTALLVAAFLRSPGGLAPLGTASPPPTAAEAPSRAPSPTPAVTPSVGAGGFGSPEPPRPGGEGPGRGAGGTPTTPPPPGTRLPLTALYTTSSGGPGLLGYQATVTITNPGTVVPPGWLLTVTLPRSTLRVAKVTGATARQDGATWTFTPDGSTAKVPPGGSVNVSFEVQGATLIAASPTACTIDGRACEGLRA